MSITDFRFIKQTPESHPHPEEGDPDTSTQHTTTPATQQSSSASPTRTNKQTPPAKEDNTSLPPPPPEPPVNPPPGDEHSLTLFTLNVRAMRTSIIDLCTRLQTHSPAVISLTETKHERVNSLWRQLLGDYKLIHHPVTPDPETGRCSAGTILAVRRSLFSTSERLPIPMPMRPYIAAAIVTPHIGTPFIVISLYMPQLDTPQHRETYGEVLTTVEEIRQQHTEKTIYIGGDLQATPEPDSSSYHPLLQALHPHFHSLNDPTLPTFQPASTPLDHWLTTAPDLPAHATTSIYYSTGSDHSALIVTIPPPYSDIKLPHQPAAGQQAQTRTHPVISTPVPPQLIQLYQHSTPELRQLTTTLLTKLQHMQNPTTDHIDELAQELLHIISTFHERAIEIWDTKPPPQHHRVRRRTTTRPLTTSSLRRLTRLAQLRNSCSAVLKERRTAQDNTDDGETQATPLETRLQDEALHTLGEQGPIDPTEIQAKCRNEIGSILRDSKKKHEDRMTEKENTQYDSNRKAYHKELKVEAGLLPKAGTLPTLNTVRTDRGPSSDPATVVDKVNEFFTAELRKVTPEDLPRPPTMGRPT